MNNIQDQYPRPRLAILARPGAPGAPLAWPRPASVLSRARASKIISGRVLLSLSWLAQLDARRLPKLGSAGCSSACIINERVLSPSSHEDSLSQARPDSIIS